jgi:hypothetical protein
LDQMARTCRAITDERFDGIDNGFGAQIS